MKMTEENERILAEQRVKLNQTLKDTNYYPHAASPGDCYIFDVVLGIDPRTVVAGTITEKKYKVWYPVKDVPGQRIIVTREFDQKQRRLLKDWWELLSPEIR